MLRPVRSIAQEAVWVAEQVRTICLLTKAGNESQTLAIHSVANYFNPVVVFRPVTAPETLIQTRSSRPHGEPDRRP